MRRRVGVSEIILLKSIIRTEKSKVNHELVRGNELSVPVMILKKGFCLQNEEKKMCGLGWIIFIPVIFQKMKGFSSQNMEKRRLLCWGGTYFFSF